MKGTIYRYCVKIRFHSELYTQPGWVPVSWHETISGAKESLAWQKKHGGENLEAKIFAA